MSYLQICNLVEELVRRAGGEPAFPCNLCVNSVAAHYTAEVEDQGLVHEGDVVKVDIGVQIDGLIADTAVTVSFNPQFDGLAQAAEEALGEAVGLVREGVRVGELGRVISDVAGRRGYRPISNLCGHSLEPYQIHAGLSIPNVWVPGSPALKAGKVYAIEPFLTAWDGLGRVQEQATRNIFGLRSRKRIGDRRLDGFAELVWTRYRTLPFAARYFAAEYDNVELKQIIEQLLRMKVIRAYPVLVEPRGRVVAQAEHTVVPTENGAVVLTE